MRPKQRKMNNWRKAVKSYEYTLCIKRDFWKKKYLECSITNNSLHWLRQWTYK